MVHVLAVEAVEEGELLCPVGWVIRAVDIKDDLAGRPAQSTYVQFQERLSEASQIALPDIILQA